MVDKDPLYLIFEKYLHSGEFDRRPEIDLIDAITQEYMVFLTAQGMVGYAHEPSMREDVALEVRDMLKMKTYGAYSVRHYNMRRGSG
jgi:hypothetical protein